MRHDERVTVDEAYCEHVYVRHVRLYVEELVRTSMWGCRVWRVVWRVARAIDLRLYLEGSTA